MFNTLYSHTRNEELVLNRRYEELSNITSIVDPDKFPIFSLIEHLDTYDLVSIWDWKKEIMEKVSNELGYRLLVKQSEIEHHESGDGVFLKCSSESNFIKRGTLLGFVPGV